MATCTTITTTDGGPKKPSSNFGLYCFLLLVLGAGVVVIRRPALLQMIRPILLKLLELVLLLFKAFYLWLPE
jgi:hypothetical protein